MKLFFDIHDQQRYGPGPVPHPVQRPRRYPLFPFIGLLARLLVRLYPDRKAVLTVYIDKTPTEVADAASEALKKEIHHLLEECQLYNLRLSPYRRETCF